MKSLNNRRSFPRLRIFINACIFYLYNSFVTHVPFYAVRHWYLRNLMRIRIGKGTSIHMGCFFTWREVKIGDNSVINRNCTIDGRAGVTIGNCVSISPETCILSLSHDINDPNFAAVQAPVEIEDYVWIAARATILPGTKLGKGCVIGAGAVVSRSIEEFTVAAGVPARKIGARNRELAYRIDYHPWFNTDFQAKQAPKAS